MADWALSKRNDLSDWTLVSGFHDLGGGTQGIEDGEVGVISITIDASTTSGSGGISGGQDGFYLDIDTATPVTSADDLPNGFQLLTFGSVFTYHDFVNILDAQSIFLEVDELGIPATNVTSPYTFPDPPDNALLFVPFTVQFTITAPVSGQITYDPSTAGETVFATGGTYDTLAPGDEVLGFYESPAPGIRAGQDATIKLVQPGPPRGMLLHGPFTEDNPFWGYPGHAVSLGNKLYYAAGGYEIGTDFPTIRVWDGLTDTEVCKIPAGLSGTVPFAITCMTAMTDRYILVGVWNTGLTSTTATGSLLRLRVSDGSLTTMGFSEASGQLGHIPSCVLFGNERIWVGSHRLDDPAAGGAIWRSDFDVTSLVPGAPFWPVAVLPTDLEALNQGSVVSMTFGGQPGSVATGGYLYFGTTAPAGTFGGIGAINALNAIGDIITPIMVGSGGTAQDWNGFYSITQFRALMDNVPGLGDIAFYTIGGFWNPDASPVSKLMAVGYEALVGPTAPTDIYTDATGTQIMSIALDGKITANLAGGNGGQGTVGTLYAFGASKQSGVYTGLVIFNRNPEDLTEWENVTANLVLTDDVVTLASRAPTNAFGIITV